MGFNHQLFPYLRGNLWNFHELSIWNFHICFHISPCIFLFFFISISIYIYYICIRIYIYTYPSTSSFGQVPSFLHFCPAPRRPRALRALPLQQAVEQLPAGATLRLPPGRFANAEPIVLRRQRGTAECEVKHDRISFFCGWNLWFIVDV